MKKATRDTIKETVKLTLINVAILIGAMMVLYLLSVALFATIFNAILGDPDKGMYAVNVLLRICLPAVTTLTLCIPHVKSSTVRREFLNALGADRYDRKADLKKLAKTKEFFIECILFTVIYVVMFFTPEPPKWIFIASTFVFPFGSLWNDAGILFMSNPPQWIFLVAIIVFPFVNLWHHTAVHKKWASERLHFGNHSTANNEN